MRTLFSWPRATLSLFCIGLVAEPLRGSWADRSNGLPLLEYFPAKNLGAGKTKWRVLEDKYGRLFVGGDGLQVFDGQAWRTFPAGIAGYPSLVALAFGSDSRLWAGAMNEIGYFTEESLGEFKYHSLTALLPKEQRLVGEVWGCAQVGQAVYFICRDKILRWDGSAFEIRPYEGTSRLFPIKLGDEYWFHHLETGLYRLSEAGPQLEIPASMLPEAGILGLTRDENGLLVASGHGLFRPGRPPRRISDEQVSQHITDNRLASFIPLPGGNYAFGTVNGGTIIVSQAGALLRLLDTDDGMPTRSAFSFQTDPNGYLWCGTPNGIINLESSGSVSVFNAFNGLQGQVNGLFHQPDGRLLALTLNGVLQLEETPTDGGQFRRLPGISATYFHLLPIARGLLLSRLGGIDLFDGARARTILGLIGTSVYFILPVRADPKSFYVLESGGLYRLSEQPDGSFVQALLTKLPSYGLTLHEDLSGRLWIGTGSQGAFNYDPATQQLSQVKDPSSGQPLSGPIFVLGANRGVFLLGNAGLLQAQRDGTDLKLLADAPALNPADAIEVPDGNSLLVAIKRPAPANNAIPGLGLVTFGAAGRAQWSELDVPAFSTIGTVNTMEFTRENGRPILWVGGSEGVLRFDYDTLKPLPRPSPPFVQLDLLNAGQIPGASGHTFSFQHHRLKFRVFTGEYTRTKGWLVQSRLGSGTSEWSAASPRRSFEYTSLSEGDYRFEVRAVNAAGLTSAPAGFDFRILPPWYRSAWAFVGYVFSAGLAVFVFIRIRERRILARNQQLEALVEVRTAELVKASAAKDEFLAGISHEIRNPMSGVIGIADNLKTEGLDPDSRHKFGLLRQCATHLSALLEDILDFSRVQAGAIDIEAKPFNLPELIESIDAMTAADSEKRGIPVEFAVSPAVPRDLIGDPKRIRQILLNFVSNALKFSGRGKVRVTVWCKTLGPERAEVIFAISDEGPGIAPEEQKRLFTRFERGAAAQRGRVPGTGLGLALCKGLAEKMGGRIWLESEPGSGSCFYFSAQFAIVAPAAATAPAAAPVAVSRNCSALVVDDQEYNRVVLADLLETLGFTVQLAAEGATALALAEKQAFDVVLLDYNMPGLSGVDVTHGIRALPGGSAKALILATTAFSTPENRAQCIAAGMDAFLGKPVTMERLRKALGAAPARSPAPAAVAPKPAPDGLANLRLLARKKKTPFADELALYLSEFDVELGHLMAALRTEDAADAGHYAHLLYGRCSFIAERELEQTLRKIEAVSATAQWEEARSAGRDVQAQLADLRVRLAAADGPVAPPASAR
ncbi:MAG: rpfC 3 [Lacunisphaera sp.]|nr:rpfC 3 [Lacunisphaera sp.]